MKISDKQLDQLIAEMLNEKTIKLKGWDNDLKKTAFPTKRTGQKAKDLAWLVGSSAPGFDEIKKIYDKFDGTDMMDKLLNLAKQGGTPNILNSKDFQAMVVNPDNEYHELVLNWLNMMHRNSSGIYAQMKEKEKQAAPSLLSAGDRLIRDTHESILNLTRKMAKLQIRKVEPDKTDSEMGGESPTPEFPVKGVYATASTRARTPLTFVRIFNNVLAGTTDLVQRFTKLQTIVNSFSTGKAAGTNFTDKVAGVYVVDMLKSIVQDYEAASAGFLFENFLAMLANGTVEGGNRKIDDFYIGADLNTALQIAADDKAGTPASAKLLASNETDFPGSTTLFKTFFTSFPNAKILYVVGVKATNLKKVQIHFHEITADVFAGGGTIQAPKNSSTVEHVTSGSKKGKSYFKLGSGGAGHQNSVTLNLESVIPGKNYNQTVETVLNDALKDIGTVNKLINATRVSITKMATSDDVNERNRSALTALRSYNDLTNIVNPIEKATDPTAAVGSSLGKQIKKTKRRAAVNENNQKISEETLDKLIQEVILSK